MATPSSRMPCETKSSRGRRSTITAGRRAAPRPAAPPRGAANEESVGVPSVVHFLLDEAELDDGERDDDRHQHHRLRRRATEVERLEAIVVDLVDEDRRVLARASFGRRIDDAEGVEEGVDNVDDEQEK